MLELGEVLLVVPYVPALNLLASSLLSVALVSLGVGDSGSDGKFSSNFGCLLGDNR